MTTPARTLLQTTSGVSPVLLSEEDFPADTAIALMDNSDFGCIKQEDGSWKDLSSDALILIQEVPSGAFARVVRDDDPFESLLYRKIACGQWSLIGAELKDRSVHVSVLVQSEYKAQPRPSDKRVEVNYHAVRLAHLLNCEAEVRDPLEPAATAIDNEKLTIRYCFPDCLLPERQVRMRPANKPEKRKTRKELADMIANDLRTKLKDLQKTGKTLLHDCKPVNFDDIVLLSVVFNSQGTMQPRLAVVSKSSIAWDADKHTLVSL
ncbi:hypothetical protein GY45DRAFT_878285 [Cubamyces sp. BRFM 1775]|nr:hypothetical protein GY45DRAFT_878285 [Cubamyces sp. BRFM 1775]